MDKLHSQVEHIINNATRRRCFLWFHKWEKWSTPKDITATMMNDSKRFYYEQTRECMNCGELQVKEFLRGNKRYS